MEPRTKPAGSPSSFGFLLLLLLLALSSTVRAIESSIGCTVLPSNNSHDLAFTHKRFHLQSGRFNLPSGVIIAPLTQTLVNSNGTDLQSFNVTGNLVSVNAQNSLQSNTSDIAFVSCDPSVYRGNLDASATVTNLLTAQNKAAAVLLYSTSASHCNFTVNDGAARQYSNVFTLLNSTLATDLNSQFNSLNSDSSVSIIYNMSFIGTATSPMADGPTDSPNTAMIILYSITGIITALFLAIIVTGAVRAHRHPERYGPRHTAGRPRQSRARGIARAMLDTIPIVKFGDNHDSKVDAAKGDVEMSLGTEEDGANHLNKDREINDADGALQPGTNDRTISDIANSPANVERRGTPTSRENESPAEQPNFSCPICTDDFIKGQDLRVLPCNHQFHPECIDPWLVNVSGTCPLCRIDLNPAQVEEDNEHGEAEASPDHSNAPMADATPNRQHRRISSYLHGTLNARRMRDATVEERLAALRSVREAASQSAQNEDADERQHRRSRLTARLRDRFRIRTHTHGITEVAEEN